MYTNQSNYNRLSFISAILVQKFQHIFSRNKGAFLNNKKSYLPLESMLSMQLVA